jgi:hypothetical protein
VAVVASLGLILWLGYMLLLRGGLPRNTRSIAELEISVGLALLATDIGARKEKAPASNGAFSYAGY